MSNDKLYGLTELLKKKMIIPAQDVVDLTFTVLPTTPRLDIALGGGIRSGSFVTLSGKPKSGKAQPLDSTVFTPDGPKKMGELKVGDEVCTPFNGTAKIDAVFPQGKIATYKVTFNDDSSVECSEDHLWYVKDCKKETYETLTLKQLIQIGLTKKDGTKNGRARWQVPICNPVIFNERQLLIDPYVLGCLIGDGGLTNGSIVLTSNDNELINAVSDRLKYNYRLNNKKNTIAYTITVGRTGGRSNYYIEALRKYGLSGKNSHNKFIPEDYLLSSIQDRWLLLAGLLDTDGTICKKGNITYSTVSRKLANDFIFLVQSLGGICKLVSRTTRCNGKNFKSFRITVKFTDKNSCFLLSRKKDRIRDRKKPDLKRTIKSVEFVSYKECQCIHLDDNYNLYLTDNFIVTHNSSLALQIIANAQQEEYGKRDAFYFDIEFRLGQKELTGVEGLVVARDMDEFGLKVIRSTKEHILSAEDILNSAEQIIEMYPGSIIVLDSASAMSTADELASQVTASSRSQSPKLFANFLRKVKEKVPLNDVTFINISHLIANTSGFGPLLMEDGGNKKEYQNDTKLRIKSFKKWEEAGEQIGQEVEWQVFWTSLGKPGKTVTTRLRYGVGYDKVEETIEMALELSLIKSGGAWFTIKNENGEEEKINGRAKLAAFLREKPAVVNRLNLEIKELLK